MVFDETSEVATEGEPAFSRTRESRSRQRHQVADPGRAGGLDLALPEAPCGQDRHVQYETKTAAGGRELRGLMVGYTRRCRRPSGWERCAQAHPDSNAPIYGKAARPDLEAFMDAYLEGKPVSVRGGRTDRQTPPRRHRTTRRRRDVRGPPETRRRPRADRPVDAPRTGPDVTGGAADQSGRTPRPGGGRRNGRAGTTRRRATVADGSTTLSVDT